MGYNKSSQQDILAGLNKEIVGLSNLITKSISIGWPSFVKVTFITNVSFVDGCETIFTVWICYVKMCHICGLLEKDGNTIKYVKDPSLST